jgi:hypothetical protein
MRVLAVVVTLLLAFSLQTARAEEAVAISGGALGRALLNKPANVRAVAILVPGGDGVMNIQPDGSFSSLRGNQLVRTRRAYLGYGVATLTVDRDVNLGAAIAYARKIAPRVALVGTSRGTQRAASAIAAGAKPNSAVFTAGFLNDVRGRIGSPGRLPPTLVVHHRNDECRHTPPSAVEPFKQWGGGRVTVVWMTGGPGGTPYCMARSYHGFQGLDSQVVAAVARYVASH